MLSLLPKGSRILDAGAGECRYKPYCNHLIYISQDFCEYTGVGNKKGNQTRTWNVSQIDIVSNITHIPEPDESFDAILCTEVLEHLPNPIMAIKEFSRLLKTGGVLILTAPFMSLTHFAPYHYCSGFDRYFFELYLPKYDFKINKIIPNGNFFEFVNQEYCRLPKVALDYCLNKGKISNIKYFFITTMWHILEKFLISPICSYLSRNSSSASDLACFGYHIRANKI